MQTRERAYAKINYLLYVGACRADGFHDVSTLMQTISLYDELLLTISDGEGISLIVEGNNTVPTDSRNLVWRAATAFMACIGEQKHVDIILKKKIPMAGGLAGGSADAAATLRALNRLFHNPMTTQDLVELSATLGSDIGFCVVGGLAHCSGRGEVVSPLPQIPGSRHFLIYNGGEAVSTPTAYKVLDATPRFDTKKITPQTIVAALNEDLTALSEVLHNDFEEVILPMCPLASAARDAFLQNGAVASMMSGSGSTIFAMFESEATAKSAQAILPFATIYAYDVFPEMIQEEQTHE